MLAIILIIVGISLRFAPHAPNFTPVAAIALFGGVYLNRKYSVFVPLVLMIASDIVLGLHNVVPFTWGGFMVISFLGIWLKKHKTVSGILSGSVLSSVIFYVISNFGVWAMGWYTHDARGLVQCYVMALPFLRNFTAATLMYTIVFFGAHELIARSVKETKLANVLL